MSGLRKVLLERGAFDEPKPTSARRIRRSDADLLREMDRLQGRGRKIKKFGYGGDVEGGADEGVGGSDDTDTDFSGGGGWGDYAGDGIDYGGLSEGMGNYGEANGYGRDFSGDGNGDRGGSIDWGGLMEGATIGDRMDGVTFDGGEGDFGSIGALGGLNLGFGDFGGLTANGALTGGLSYANSGLGRTATPDLDIAVDDLAYQDAPTARTPSEGTLAAIARADQLSGLVEAIAGIETKGQKDPYTSVGAKTASGDRAYGFSQVMGANIPSWTAEYYGKELSPKGYLGTPEAQRAVTQGRLGDLMDKYGPIGAAEAWYAGEKGMKNRDATDVHGRLTVDDYGKEVAAALGLAGVTTAPSAFPDTAPTPPSRPDNLNIGGFRFGDDLGPYLEEGDPVPGARVDNFESSGPQVRGVDQSGINAAIMGELAGPQQMARAEEQDRAERSQQQQQAAVSAAQEAQGSSPLSALASAMATGTAPVGMDFGLTDLRRDEEPTSQVTSAKDQSRVAERTDLPQLTFDQNAAGRAAMGPVNAERVTGPTPARGTAASNPISDAIAGLFGLDGAAKAAPASAPAAKAMAVEDFDAIHAATATPGSMAAYGQTPSVQVATAAAAPVVEEKEEAAPARTVGTQVAGMSVVPQDRPNQTQTRSTTPGTASTGQRSRGVATDDVYGPTMPGMAPGMTSYPERGIINQPSTPFHEKVAERVGVNAARGVGNMVSGGLFGLADMASGWIGGPSLSGLFANSTPGLDIGLGLQDPGDRENPRTTPGQSRFLNPAAPPKPGPTPGSGGTPAPGGTGTGGSIQVQPKFNRRYLGPPKNATTYGYGPERTFFEYYRDGGPVGALSRVAKKGVDRGGALPRGALSMLKAKRTV